jgi:hypothetical protein
MQDKLSKTTLAASVVFLVVSITAFVFLYKIIVEKNKDIINMQLDWQVELTKREEIKQLDRSMEALKEERVLLDTHFAKGSDIVPFLDTIELLAVGAGIQAEIFSVDAPKGSTTLGVSIRSTGTFEQLYKFLLLLENSPYELEVSFMDLQKTSISDTASREWGANFKIKLISFLP